MKKRERSGRVLCATRRHSTQTSLFFTPLLLLRCLLTCFVLITELQTWFRLDFLLNEVNSLHGGKRFENWNGNNQANNDQKDLLAPDKQKTEEKWMKSRHGCVIMKYVYEIFWGPVSYLYPRYFIFCPSVAIISSYYCPYYCFRLFLPWFLRNFFLFLCIFWNFTYLVIVRVNVWSLSCGCYSLLLYSEIRHEFDMNSEAFTTWIRVILSALTSKRNFW